MRVQSLWVHCCARLRIRTRLALLVLALAVPFLVFSVISAVQEARIETGQAQAQMLSTARVTAARLDDHINDVRQVLLILSAIVGVEAAHTASNDALLKSLASKLPNDVNNVSVWDATGNNVGSLDTRLRTQGGQRVPQRKFFRDAMAGAALAIEAPVVSISNGALIGIFAIPVQRGGQVAGVVAASVRLAPLQALLMPDGLGQGSVITITDVSGVVLARSVEPEKWIGRNLKTAAAGGAAEAIVKGEGVRIGPSADGVERVAGFTTARAVPWLVYVGVPKQIALAAAHQRLINHLLTAGAMLAAGLMLAYGVGEGIASPLRKLGAEAEKLGAGAWAGIETKAHGEVGVLATTLDRMAGQLRERTAALEAHQRQLRQITDNLPALISYIDTDLRFRFANASYEAWLGLDPVALIGRSLPELYGAETYEGFRLHIERALGGARVTYERELRTAAGTRRVDVTAVPDVASDGRVAGIYVLMVDVTADRVAQAALAASEHRLQMISSNIPALVAYIDRDERFRFVNPAVEQAFGVAAGDLLGRTILEVRGHERHAELQPYIARVLRGERVSFERTLQVGGRLSHYQSTYVPDTDAGGAVIGYYSMTFDITALKETERQLDLLARRDSLTGLPNRRDFNERLEAAMARCRRSKVPMALMFLDVDRFKAINDAHGHATGDAVLKEFAARLRRGVRTTDTVARLSGDEFVVIVEGLNTAAEVSLVSEKLGEAIRAPMHVEGTRLCITSSIGYAIFDGLGGSAEALTARADSALYRAKAAGRDTYASTNFSELAA